MVVHHPVTFHPANGVCPTDLEGGHATLGGGLGRGEVPPTWLLFGVDHRDVGQDQSLAAQVLIAITSGRPARARQLSQGVIVGLACIGRTQAAHLAGFIDHQEVFDRRAFLLAAVVFLLGFWIGWAVDRPRRTILPNRGESGPSWVGLLVRRVAHSAAVRAGSRSGCPHA